MAVWRVGMLWSGVLLMAACGASRATRTSCSKTNAVVDPGLSPGTARPAFESYDPTAALLIFKASADKVSIESRCNARLVQKLRPIHRAPGGFVSDANAPVNLNQLDFELSNSNDTLELLTSAHCFFRVWDPRVVDQVKSNPSLAQEPAKSLLADQKTRYQLFKSMLTNPQKLVTFDQAGNSVVFNYKLSTTDVYSRFFDEIEKSNNDSLRKIVGREFSKTSVLLDELALDVCGTDEKVLSRSDATGAARNSLMNALDMKDFISKGGTPLEEMLRTRIISSGRHKLCFSQTDMIVAPIQFTNPITPAHQAQISAIYSIQKERVDSLKSQFSSSSAVPIEKRFFAEFTKNSEALPTPTGATQCKWADKNQNYFYQGLSITDPFVQAAGSYAKNWDATDAIVSANLSSWKKIFPNLNTSLASVPEFRKSIQAFINEAMAGPKCNLQGFKFNSDANPGTCTTDVEPDMGRCPASEDEAKKTHLNVNASLRLAFVSSVLSLPRLRETHAHNLTLPIAALHDLYTQLGCESSSTGDCGLAKKIETVISGLTTSFPDKDVYLARFDSVSVDKVDSEKLVFCSPRNAYRNDGTTSTTDPIAIDISRLFINLSEKSKALLRDGVARDNSTTFNNLGSKFLLTKCINAGGQLLYSGLAQSPGLLQNIRFAELSIINSNQVPGGGRVGLSNQEIFESGRASRLMLANLIFGNEVSALHPQTVNGKLIGTGHLQINYCNSSGLDTEGYCGVELANQNYLDILRNNDSADFDARFAGIPAKAPFHHLFAARALPNIHAHLTFNVAIPSWLPAAEKEKYGDPTFPGIGLSGESARYFLSAGDSGTTVSLFGLFPVFMLSAVQDIPVSGGLAVIPSTGGQQVPAASSGGCR
ncbi:hypothetical protein EBU99_05125 [bacterium]|nr:hypothetical protein [bacterium]